MAFLGEEEQLMELQDRFRIIYIVVGVGLLILVARLVHLQILMGERWAEYSENNRIKRVEIPAPRGMMFDRNGTLLIDNRPAFDLEITPQYIRESKQEDKVIELLAKLIGSTPVEINEKLEKAKGQPAFLPVKIKRDLDRDTVARIKTWQIAMPGVSIKMEIRRTNVFGSVSSHTLGTIGKMSGREYNRLKDSDLNYRKFDFIGKTGLELQMEHYLRGEDGEQLVEVDALGRIRLDKGKNQSLIKKGTKPEIPGKNIVLSIDQDLQMAAVEAFGDKKGAAVAIDPQTGEILAMVSQPSFDSTEFSRGISYSLWNTLRNDPYRPLRNKPVQDHFPPGSVFKAVTAIALLEEGIIDLNSRFVCKGRIKVGRRYYHCHKESGHGEMNIISALTQSCNVFFLRSALKLKSVDVISKWARKLGLGTRTGIKLAGEVPGLIPTEAWKDKRFHTVWNQGETLSVAIGQSFVLTTTVQLANLYAAISMRGKRYRPFLVKRIEDYSGKILNEHTPEVLEDAFLSDKTYDTVVKGLWGVVNDRSGTAYWRRIPGVDYAGKTGTAQVIGVSADKIYGKCDTYEYAERNHGVFAGFAPIQNPRIAVAVFAEHSCSGSGGAAPIAKKIVETYLEKLYKKEGGRFVITQKESIRQAVHAANASSAGAIYRSRMAEKSAHDSLSSSQSATTPQIRAGGHE